MRIDEQEYHGYYEGFSNAALWPLYHHALREPVLDREEWWTNYQTVNTDLADAIAKVAGRDALVWVHDYHLQLVPRLIRERRDDLRIGFFLHIPFPPYELFSRLPRRSDILAGLLGADMVGFQTRHDGTNFIQAVLGSGAASAATGGLSTDDGRVVAVDAHPISIDDVHLCDVAAQPEVRSAARQLRAELGEERTVILGVDRLDYSKGIDLRLRAFQRLLERRPELASELTLVQVAVPSRQGVLEYQNLRDEVERLVGSVNGSFGQLGRPVVHYLHAELRQDDLVAVYLAADIMMVTPLADGMNLVAKEFATVRQGDAVTLILSEFAGAAFEMSSDSIVVNPFDIEAMSEGIEAALGLSEQEQRDRSRRLGHLVAANNVFDWSSRFLQALAG